MDNANVPPPNWVAPWMPALPIVIFVEVSPNSIFPIPNFITGWSLI